MFKLPKIPPPPPPPDSLKSLGESLLGNAMGSSMAASQAANTLASLNRARPTEVELGIEPIDNGYLIKIRGGPVTYAADLNGVGNVIVAHCVAKKLEA
jgi:hypothetical protein